MMSGDFLHSGAKVARWKVLQDAPSQFNDNIQSVGFVCFKPRFIREFQNVTFSLQKSYQSVFSGVKCVCSLAIFSLVPLFVI